MYQPKDAKTGKTLHFLDYSLRTIIITIYFEVYKLLIHILKIILQLILHLKVNSDSTPSYVVSRQHYLVYYKLKKRTIRYIYDIDFMSTNLTN